jgi:O-antigen/teichoic acid export membrane protein
MIITKNDSWSLNSFMNRIGLLAFSSIVKFLVQIVILILAAKKLSLPDYGIYQLVWMYLNFFSVVLLFGAYNLIISANTTSLTKWFAVKRKPILICVVLFHAITFLYLLVFTKYFSTIENIILAFVILAQNIAIIFEAIAIKKENEKQVFIASILYSFILFAIHIYAFFYSYNLLIILVGILLASLIKTILLFTNTSKTIPQEYSQSETSIYKKWMYLGVNDLLGIIVKWIDKWIVLLLLPISQFAVYFNGTFEIPIFLIILGAVGNISIVDMGKVKKENTKAILQIFQKSSLLMSTIIIPAFCFLLFFGSDFFVLVFGEKYVPAIPIFQISIFIIPARIIYSTTFLQVYNENKIIVNGSILDFVLAILFMLLLYPVLQMKGLALAFVLSTYIQVGYYLWHTKRITKISMLDFFRFKEIFILCISSIIMMLLCKYMLSTIFKNAGLFFGVLSCGLLFLSFFYILNTHWIKNIENENESSNSIIN